MSIANVVLNTKLALKSMYVHMCVHMKHVLTVKKLNLKPKLHKVGGRKIRIIVMCILSDISENAKLRWR